MKWKLVNPSDYYEFEAPRLEVAHVVVLLIGKGRYGATPIGHESPDVPIDLFADKARTDQLVAIIENGLASLPREVVKSLRSLTLGPGKERSSMNDIGAFAGRVADRLDEKYPPPTAHEKDALSGELGGHD